jgi:hypothetical protein
MLLCAFCHRPIKPGAPKRRSAGATYHPGCFDRKDRASSVETARKKGRQDWLTRIGDSPAVRKLLNARTKDGTLLCPGCQQPIPPKVGAQFRDGYAVHLHCHDDTPETRSRSTRPR